MNLGTCQLSINGTYARYSKALTKWLQWRFDYVKFIFCLLNNTILFKKLCLGIKPGAIGRVGVDV